MPKQESAELVRQGRALVKQSKQLCDASRERIKRGKHLRHIDAVTVPPPDTELRIRARRNKSKKAGRHAET